MAAPPPPPLPGHLASYVVFLHGGLKEVYEPLFDVSKFGFHISLESLAYWL